MIVVGLMIIALIVILTLTSKDEAPQSVQCHAEPPAQTQAWTMFESFDKQLEIVERVHKAWFGEPVDIMNTKYGKYVICDWFMYKSYVASNDDSYKSSLEKFNADSMDLVGTEGIRGNFWASVTAFDMFVGAMNDENKKNKIYDTCRDITPELEKFFPNEIASFLKLAQLENLLDQNGNLLDDKKLIAKLLYRNLWVKASELQYPHRALLSPEEEMAMFRWQVELSHMTPDAKQAKIEQMRVAFPNHYDYDYALAMILFQSGNAAAACEKLRSVRSADAQDVNKARYDAALAALHDADPVNCP